MGSSGSWPATGPAALPRRVHNRPFSGRMDFVIALAKQKLAARRQARSEQPYYKWVVLGTVVFSLLIIMLDVTVVNVSIPRILTDFHADIANVQWVFNAYTLAFAASLITFGRLGDMYGHKTLFLIGLVVFGIGSVASGAAPDIGWLIGFRALQGIGGAMMMPATLALLFDAFPKEQRGLALGFWGAIAGIALTIGPLLGGFITDHYTWRWVFYINVPVVVLALTLTTVFIHQQQDILRKAKLDLAGFFTVTLGLLALVFALIEGQKYGWGSTLIVSLLAGAALLLAAFVLVERRVAAPMINVQLFKDRDFAIGNAVALLISFALLGAFFLIPLFVQQVLGFTAFKSGLITVPMSAVMLVTAPNVGRLSDRYGTRPFLVVGLVLASVGLWLLSHFSVHTTASSLILPFAVFGLGMACVMPVMVNVALANVPATQYGAGSGVLNTFRQLGGVFGIAIVGTFFTAQVTALVPPALAHNAKIPPVVTTRISDQLHSGNVQLSETANLAANVQALPSAQRAQAQRAAATIGREVQTTIGPEIATAVNRTFRFALIFTLIGAVAAAFTEPPKRRAAAAKQSPAAAAG